MTETQINLAELEESIVGGTTARRGDLVMARGEGCWLYDVDDKCYLDLASAQGVAMLGHSHPALVQAIQQQAETLISCPNFFYNDTRAQFSAKLKEVLPDQLNHIFLANSGAESIDGALKFARLATSRSGIVSTMRSFHGRTIGALSVTWEPKYRKKFAPLLDVDFVPYGNLEKLDAALTSETAALILEPLQGEGGVNTASPDFFQGAQKLCRERGIMLIIDEIQTGFGRTGKWFGHQHFDLEPDIICMAKGLGSGFPMGAIAYTDCIQEMLFPGAHGSTFGGNPLACAAGLAAIQTYQDDNLIERANEMGDYLNSRLTETLAGYTIVREVRQLGLMVGIELREKVGRYLRALMEEHNVIALPAGSNVLRLLPPLIITKEEIDIGVAAIAAVLPNA